MILVPWIVGSGRFSGRLDGRKNMLPSTENAGRHFLQNWFLIACACFGSVSSSSSSSSLSFTSSVLFRICSVRFSSTCSSRVRECYADFSFVSRDHTMHGGQQMIVSELVRSRRQLLTFLMSLDFSELVAYAFNFVNGNFCTTVRSSTDI